MPVILTIPIKAIGKVLDAAAAVGVAPEELCRVVQLDLSKLEDVDARITFTQLVMLYEHATRLTGDDAFGLHVGERSSPKMYDVLGYVTMNSMTFGESLDRLLRFTKIWTDAVAFTISVTNSNAHLSYVYRINELSREERRQESEQMLSALMRFGRLVTGVDWTPREVHFEHAEPENVSEHQRIFGAPLRFNNPLTTIVFDASILMLPLVEADPVLGALLERQAEELLAKFPQRGACSDQVRQLLGKTLSSRDSGLESISRKLGVSARTLQRKLREEDVTYEKLFEEMQRELAVLYLQRPEMTIGEIAFLLGFSQPSAFHRAFRRWHGKTPKEFRKTQYDRVCSHSRVNRAW